MKKIPLLAIGAAALAVAGFGSAASAHERGPEFSFGIMLGGPPVVVEDRGYDSDRAYWEHRRWEQERHAEQERRWEERRRFEAYQREQARENCEHDRGRAEHAGWRHDGGDWGDR